MAFIQCKDGELMRQTYSSYKCVFDAYVQVLRDQMHMQRGCIAGGLTVKGQNVQDSQ